MHRHFHHGFVPGPKTISVKTRIKTRTSRHTRRATRSEDHFREDADQDLALPLRTVCQFWLSPKGICAKTRIKTWKPRTGRHDGPWYFWSEDHFCEDADQDQRRLRPTRVAVWSEGHFREDADQDKGLQDNGGCVQVRRAFPRRRGSRLDTLRLRAHEHLQSEGHFREDADQDPKRRAILNFRPSLMDTSAKTRIKTQVSVMKAGRTWSEGHFREDADQDKGLQDNGGCVQVRRAFPRRRGSRLGRETASTEFKRVRRTLPRRRGSRPKGTSMSSHLNPVRRTLPRRRGSRLRGSRSDIRKAPELDYRLSTNPVTGEKRAIPLGIDPGWDYNPGEAGAFALPVPMVPF